MWTILFFSAALLIFTLPLLPALLELIRQQDIAPVAINQGNAGNADYFAESFLEVMEQAIAEYLAGQEYILDGQSHALIEEAGQFRPDGKEQKSATVDRMLIGLSDLDLPSRFNFNNDVFSRASISFGAHALIRSALALGDLRLDDHCRLLRWLHAENVVAGPGCLLLGRVSARRDIVLQPDCRFHRLNAGKISVQDGAGFNSGGGLSARAPKTPRINADFLNAYCDVSGRVLLNGNLDFPENGFWQGDMVVRGNALIRGHGRIQGSLKVYGRLIIESGAVIEGAIFCNRQIHIAEECRLAGPLSAEQSMEIRAGTEVGGTQTLTSVTAPIIRLHSGVRVYGTVWASQQGETLAASAGVAIRRARHVA